jgi:hypothetical protein
MDYKNSKRVVLGTTELIYNMIDMANSIITGLVLGQESMKRIISNPILQRVFAAETGETISSIILLEQSLAW